MPLTDEELRREIKQVEIKIKQDAEITKNVARRYLNWRMMREGHAKIVEYIKLMGPGTLTFDSWGIALSQVRKAAAEAELVLFKNKRNNNYMLFTKDVKAEGNEFVFNPKLLDINDDATEENEKVDAV